MAVLARLCGYACPHGHLNAETTVESVEYFPCSYDEHTVVRKTGTAQTCADCGVTISYDVEETVATEPHRTEDGTPYTPCMDCGVNSSDHSCESYMRTWTDYDLRPLRARRMANAIASGATRRRTSSAARARRWTRIRSMIRTTASRFRTSSTIAVSARTVAITMTVACATTPTLTSTIMSINWLVSGTADCDTGEHSGQWRWYAQLHEISDAALLLPGLRLRLPRRG